MEPPQWEQDTRSVLIDLVRRGRFSPDEAEREAAKRRIGPLASTPDPQRFDPHSQAWWTLAMALAWIAWRDTASVREQWNEYRELCLEWRPVSSNIRNGEAGELIKVHGHELAPVRHITACRLALIEKLSRSREELPTNPRMTISDALRKLFNRLADGSIVAIGKDTGGKPVNIQAGEWCYLRLFEEADRDVMKYGPLDTQPAFTEIHLPRDRLTAIWQEWPIEPQMIEPMTSKEEAGYVSLCSALHWIMTEAGRRTGHLDDGDAWAAAVKRLLPLLSTGEVQVIGKPKSGGAFKPIEGHTFAAVIVAQPLRDRFSVIARDDPLISCIPYAGEELWLRDFNDHFYLEKSGPASWTHLQVKKSDVLREIEFDAPPEAQPSSMYETGAPGRPSSMHLVRQEFSARYERGETAETMAREADALANWLRTSHPKAAPVSPKTIKNQLGSEFRKRRLDAQK